MPMFESLLFKHSELPTASGKSFFQKMVSAQLVLPALIIPSVLLLEAYFPAEPTQKPLSKGFFQDLVWFVGDHLLKSYIIYPYYYLIYELTKSLAIGESSFWASLSPLWQVIVSIVLLDFFAWLGHIAMHKVPFLWNFHAVHHSQTEMNLFTDLRVHFVEYFVLYTLALCALGLLNISPVSVLAYSTFQRWYLMVYHANIRFNYGPLRFLLVTPQSHRVHHSIRDNHQGQNYGVMFSFWDRAFGLQHNSPIEYPPVGIKDFALPLAINLSWLQLINNYFHQIVYPIQVSFKIVREKF